MVLQSPHLLRTRHSWDWEDELSLGSFLQFGLEGSLAKVPQENWDCRACHQGLWHTQSAPPPQCPLLPPGTVEPTGGQAALRQRLPLPVSTRPQAPLPIPAQLACGGGPAPPVHPICSDGLGGQQGRDQDFTDEETNKLSKNKDLAGGPGARPPGLAGSTLWLHRSHEQPAVVPSRIAAHRHPWHAFPHDHLVPSERLRKWK